MDHTLVAGDVISHYRIVGALGTGGMGEVYLAQDLTLERSVALKVLPPRLVHNEERLRRFVIEAKSASSLNHPGIVTIYEIGSGAIEREGESSAPIHFIAMERIDALVARRRDRCGGSLHCRDCWRLGPSKPPGVLGPWRKRDGFGPDVDPVAEIRARIERAISLFGRDRVLIQQSCGFATFADNPVASAAAAQAKIAAMTTLIFSSTGFESPVRNWARRGLCQTAEGSSRWTNRSTRSCGVWLRHTSPRGFFSLDLTHAETRGRTAISTCS